MKMANRLPPKARRIKAWKASVGDVGDKSGDMSTLSKMEVRI